MPFASTSRRDIGFRPSRSFKAGSTAARLRASEPVSRGVKPLRLGITLGMFIADTYTTRVKASRPRTAANALEELHRLFRTWYAEPLTAI